MTFEDQEGRISSGRIKQIILDQSRRAQVWHIGLALFIADLIAALYTNARHIPNRADTERDRFILSKGHAVLAVYAALFLKGWLTEDDLNTYCSDHSLLGVHPEHALRGVAFSTGLFGHGLSRESLVETALNALSAREVAR